MTRYAAFLLGLLAINGPAAAQAESSLELLRPEAATHIITRYLLQDPNGRSVTSEEFIGRYQLITFGYTYCPDICPTTLVEMAAILKLLGDDADQLQPIFITVDPERDSGEALKTYTAFFDPRILPLTGSPALIRRAADNFKIRYSKVITPGAKPGTYAVDHSAGMILLGPDGQYLKKFPYATPVDQITARIKALMQARQKP